MSVPNEGKGSLTPAPVAPAQVALGHPTARAPLAEPAPLALGACGLAALYAGTRPSRCGRPGWLPAAPRSTTRPWTPPSPATPYMLDDF